MKGRTKTPGPKSKTMLLDSDDEDSLASSSSDVSSKATLSQEQEYLQLDNHLSTAARTVGSLRSLSTPDLKHLDGISNASYKSFTATIDKDDSDIDREISSASSSSDWESADEVEVHLPLQTCRRPLRPAASASSVSKPVDQQQQRRRSKRERNKSNVRAADLYLKRSEVKGELSRPDQKATGFEGAIAAQVASFARSMHNGNSEDMWST